MSTHATIFSTTIVGKSGIGSLKKFLLHILRDSTLKLLVIYFEDKLWLYFGDILFNNCHLLGTVKTYSVITL